MPRPDLERSQTKEADGAAAGTEEVRSGVAPVTGSRRIGAGVSKRMFLPGLPFQRRRFLAERPSRRSLARRVRSPQERRPGGLPETVSAETAVSKIHGFPSPKQGNSPSLEGRRHFRTPGTAAALGEALAAPNMRRPFAEAAAEMSERNIELVRLQAASQSNPTTLRSSRLNSTPIRWTERPRWRYLSA